MMNKKRFFSFGCSFTKYWETSTWSDYISIEFENFFNHQDYVHYV